MQSEKEENNTQQRQKKNKHRKEKQTDFPLGRYSQQNIYKFIFLQKICRDSIKEQVTEGTQTPGAVAGQVQVDGAGAQTRRGDAHFCR